jgi:hypothetical protein
LLKNVILMAFFVEFYLFLMGVSCFLPCHFLDMLFIIFYNKAAGLRAGRAKGAQSDRAPAGRNAGYPVRAGAVIFLRRRRQKGILPDERS